MNPCRLSIVIVNYNVEHFLQLCLSSVFKAIEGIDAEVWVVDNHSSDGSLEMVKNSFPAVRLIASKDNLGFSKGNNLAIRQSEGEYVLLLNPDTVVAEDTFQKCLSFMDSNPNAGSLGVRMLDGSGLFLPESKRGLPSPWVSFCKAFGLGSWFPESELFGKYYLSYLPEKQTHDVDVLSGAFMFLRKTAIEKSGLLDEDFFMYGEDVDLSFRIQNAGFKNYYFPEATIIHFKGESTKRGSISFVIHFYKAMLLFSKKHFSNSRLFSIFIYLGIAVRAVLALVKRFFDAFGPAILEFIVSFIGMAFIKNWWEVNFKGVPGMYPDYFIELLIPVYLLVWIGSTRLVGRYSNKYGHESIIKGIALGTFLISGVTNFFDDYRFSKGLILIGSVWTYIVVTIGYIFGQWYTYGKSTINLNGKKRWLIAGDADDFIQASKILRQFDDQILVSGWIGSGGVSTSEPEQLGTLENLQELSFRLGIDHVLFCLKGLGGNIAIETIDRYKKLNIRFSFLAPGAGFVVSSSQKHDRGKVFQSENIPVLIQPFNRRRKRLADIFLCMGLFILFPLAIAKGADFTGLFKNMGRVLTGKKSWLGLAENHLKSFGLKDGIITMKDLAGTAAEPSLIKALDNVYVQEFQMEKEIWTVLKNLGKLGNQNRG